jgi:hypothetical protein
MPGRPADSQIDGMYLAGYGNNNYAGNVNWSGTTVIYNFSNLTFYGGEPGTGRTAFAYNGESQTFSWTGGIGSRIDWSYSAPSAPSAPTFSRNSSGTSLTATISGGGGRITYRQAAISTNGGTSWADWNTVNASSQFTFTVGAHATITIRGRNGNEDRASGASLSTTSYGIPTAVQNLSIVRSTATAGRIALSWSAPSYAGESVNRYVVTRTDTVTGISTTIVNSNITSFNDNELVRGRLYNYSIYCVGNGSPGNGLSSSVNGVMAPGVPGAPGVPTVASKVGRNVTINSTRGSDGFGNTVSAYRIQLSIDGGATWKGWDNSSKTFTADGTFNTLDSSGNFSYELLEPAQTYDFRVYGVNSIGDGDVAVTATALFVSSGGKRWTGTVWEPTQTAKRFNGTSWTDITIAKRWNGSSWVDLT